MSREVQMTAHFRDNCDREVAMMTLGDPRKPYVLFQFESLPNDVTGIHLDVTGMDFEKTLAFLEEVVHKMRTVPSQQVLPDGTRVPFVHDQPEAAEKE